MLSRDFVRKPRVFSAWTLNSSSTFFELRQCEGGINSTHLGLVTGLAPAWLQTAKAAMLDTLDAAANEVSMLERERYDK